MIRKSIEIPEPGGPRRLSYLDWGEVDNPEVVLCVHGLTRSARDFDRLAEALAEDHRVICADVAGRGESDWLKDPALYQTPTYARDMVALLDQLGVELDGRGNVAIDGNRMSSVSKVFAAGDAARGQSLVVWAIAEGRETARGMDLFLMGETSLPHSLPEQG